MSYSTMTLTDSHLSGFFTTYVIESCYERPPWHWLMRGMSLEGHTHIRFPHTHTHTHTHTHRHKRVCARYVPQMKAPTYCRPSSLKRGSLEGIEFCWAWHSKALQHASSVSQPRQRQPGGSLKPLWAEESALSHRLSLGEKKKQKKNPKCN